MYCVVSGQLELTEHTFSDYAPNYATLWPGDLVGIATLITDRPIAFSVRATADTHLMAIPLGYARKLGASQPQFVQNIQNLLVELLERANAEKAVLSISNAYQRVFAQLYLLSQPQKLGSSSPNPLPKQQDLAQIVNTSRETVSRAIALLLKAGIITKNGHLIQIHDMTRLMALAHKGPDALK
jgi:CRP-like cAMP-binding protein